MVHQNTGKENRYWNYVFAILISTLWSFYRANKKKNLSYTLYFAFGNPALTGTKPDSENICTVESTNLKSFVCVSNNTDEQTQNNINEECDKDVEINLAEDPHPQRAVDA